MKTILILSNNGSGLFKFRKELIINLMKDYKIVILCPRDNFFQDFEAIGVKIIPIKIKRRSMNPIVDISLMLKYYYIIRGIKPNLVISYTVKPNIYGSIASTLNRKKYISTITGLGTAFNKGKIVKNIVVILYKIALKRASFTFFQNEYNKNIFVDNRIISNNYMVVPGSGVNSEKFNYVEYPSNIVINFLFVGRVMIEKGIKELISAIEMVFENGYKIKLDIVGSMEENLVDLLKYATKNSFIEYHGETKDIREYYTKCNALILPSYHEGLSNVLLEAMSIGRPVLASDIPGCNELIFEGENGYTFKPRNTSDLFDKIIDFCKLSQHEKEEMGKHGRKIVQSRYEREIVVNEYYRKINEILNAE